MRRNPRITVLSFFLAFVLAALPAAAQKGGESSPRIVSSDLFDALESWSESDASIETLALDVYPEAVIGYSQDVESVYEGRRLSEHFAESYPEAHEGYRTMIEGEVEDESDFLAYVMASENEAYQKWQGEEALVASGKTFDAYVERNHPEILADLERTPTPADAGLTLDEHLRDLGREDLLEELYGILGTVGGGGNRCSCWTVVTFPHSPFNYPGPWTHEIDESINESWGFPTQRRELDYDVYAEGAAKNIDFYRKTRRTLWEQERTKNTNYSHMRVRMHCTEDGVAGGRHCAGSTCTGEMAMRVEYGSRVYQRVDVGGIWSKRARVLSSDLAELRYDPPGTAPEMLLFQKGVGVSGDVKTGWNAAAAMDVITGAAGIAALVATDGTTAATVLQSDLISSTIEGIIGLITREGEESQHDQDMFVAFDTAGTAPLPLLPNTTHLFRLDTMSHIYNRGYGGTSEGWANVDSSHFLTAVTRNYQCAADVDAPTPRAFWFYDGSGAPHTTTTLRNLVDSFVTTELGVSPSGLTDRMGQYP